jgi:cob(I)alamin adenosyltransferase
VSERSITTRGGDEGTTQLFSGERVPKDSRRTDAYGDSDELGSALGVARAAAQHDTTRQALLEVQRWLFVVNMELATSEEFVPRLRERVDQAFLDRLEERRQAAEASIRMPDGFIIPGGTLAGAHIDLARAISRRCERKVVGLVHDDIVRNPLLQVWFNRLSDYLWLLARVEEGEAVQPK